MSHNLKTGMKGSNCGKSRYAPTEHLKKESKKPRRAEGKKACKQDTDR